MNNEITKELLEKIKLVLKCKNEAQAERIIEQFIFDQEEITIEFADWMAKEYWLNSSGKYREIQSRRELYNIFKVKRLANK